MKYTSLDLTMMMNEAADRRRKLDNEIKQFEEGVPAMYDELIDRYGLEPDEDNAAAQEAELEARFKRYNKLFEMRDSNSKLFDLLESAQMELEYIELTERELNK